MSNPTIHWPDARAEQLQAARGRLEVAAQGLAARHREDVVRPLGQLLERFRDPESRWHQALIDGTVEQAGFSRETVSAGLKLGLANWSAEALAEMVQREFPTENKVGGRKLVPFPMTSVVLAGAIPMPNLLASMMPLLVGSPALIKPAARDALTPVLLSHCLSDLDAELGACIEVTPFPSTDTACLGPFLSSECVVASGSDETIREIAHQLAPSQRFVGYGHKLSLAVVNANTLRQRNHSDELARCLSADIALWDQLGCLSPACVYVVGESATEATSRLLESLADALADRAQQWPRGEVPEEVRAAIKQQRDEAEMRRAGGEDLQLLHSRDTAWTIIAETSGEWRPAPLHRFIRLHPVAGHEALLRAVQPMAGHLSSVALAGFESASPLRSSLVNGLARLGVCRVCPPGLLQAPALDWPHDGRAVLQPLARYLDSGNPEHGH